MNNNNHLAIRELPECEQPYEKVWTLGVNSLSDVELIAILLRNGSKKLNSIELSREVLKMPDGSYSLIALCKKSIFDLQKIPGIGKIKATMLKCVAEISFRISESGYSAGFKVDEPEILAKRYMDRMRHLDCEQLIAVYLNGGTCFIGDKILSTGTANKSVVSPREIFLNALKYDAVYIILIHNHPSGNPVPSMADREITSTIKEDGEKLGIKILDHIIIGDRKYFSFREHKLM